MIKIPDIPISALLKTAGGQAPFQNSLLSSIPPALLNAPSGSLVNAVVTGAGQGGSFTPKTPNGLLSIQTTLPLQQGNTLEFQIVNPGKDFQLLLVALNAQPIKKPTNTSVENKKAESQEGTTPRTLTEEDLLFTIASKTKQQPQPHTQAAPAVKTEAPSFQQGQVLQATLATIQDDNIDTLLKLFTFDTTAGKLIPTTTGQTTPIAPNILANIIKPGAVFSFRILEIALPLPNTNNAIPTTLATPAGTNPLSQTPFVNQPNTPAASTPLSTPISASKPGFSQVQSTTQAPVNVSIPSTAPNAFPAEEVAAPSFTSVANNNTAPLSANNPVANNPVANTPVANNPAAVLVSNTPIQQNIPLQNPNIVQQAHAETAFNTQAANTIPNPTIPATVTNRLSGLPLVAAMVISTEKSGDTIVKTPFGSLKLNLDTPLPKNTTLYLELSAIVPPPVTTSGVTNAQASQTPSDGLPQLMKYWTSLGESIKVVGQANPALAGHFEEALPTPDKHFGTKLMHFINTLQSGSVSEWLGQAFIKTLQQEKKTELLTQLTKEFATLRSAFTESPFTNWQTLIFPVFSEGVLHQARMYIRNMRDNDKQKQGNRDKGADARFVVEVDLEKLGSMQFDGLVRNVDNGKFFDLVIRSHKGLDPDIINDILDIFTTTQEVTGLKGKVSFENTLQFPVNPTQEILAMEGNASNSIIV